MPLWLLPFDRLSCDTIYCQECAIDGLSPKQALQMAVRYCDAEGLGLPTIDPWLPDFAAPLIQEAYGAQQVALNYICL